MRRLYALLTVLILLLPVAALGEGAAELSVSLMGDEIRPARSCLIAFTLPEAGAAAITLEREDGTLLSVILPEAECGAGTNYTWWNGTYEGVFAPAGEALLTLRWNGQTAAAEVTVGEPAPYITAVVTSGNKISPEAPELRIEGALSGPGTLKATLDLVTESEIFTLVETEEAAETLSLTLRAENALGAVLPDGEYRLTLQLVMADGDYSDDVVVRFSVEDGAAPAEAAGELTQEIDLPEDADDTVTDGEPETVGAQPENEAAPAVALLEGNDQRQYTPSFGSPYAGQDTSLNYWTLPMDITDEEAVWAMLMQPITVLDTGKKNAERAQITIREAPDDDAEGVGVVTCVTQSVHVLETQGDWTLIECYSSSFHDSKVKNWNALVQGWVPTKYLKTKTPDSHMGLVVDKLTQRLYIFVDGHLYDTLLVSTGLVNAKQPYNETRSGEFLMLVPAVGGFKDGSMVVDKAIRFNSGDLLHEVPYSTAKDGSKYYGTYEPALGTKASHGCIRVQRRTTPKGVNMGWIWKNKKNYTKIVIWEDWQGRQILPPSDDTVLYYNPKGGKSYHSCETCNSAKGKTFTAFTYGELETGDFAKLDCCPWCNPPLRLSEIAAINEKYIPGIDHNPILTEARAKQGFGQQ